MLIKIRIRMIRKYEIKIKTRIRMIRKYEIRIMIRNKNKNR